MIARSTLFRRLSGDTRGSYAIEFAILTPIMLVLMLGFIEICYQAYVTSVLQGALNKAGRDSTLETATIATIDDKVEEAVHRVAKRATFTTTRTSYSSFSDVGSPEDYNDDDGDGVHDANECFEDSNGNGQWDADRGRDDNGGADDIVAYKMTARYPRLLPLAGMLGWSDYQEVTATTTFRNQPYGSQESRNTVVCP